jgi:hypothetical protein
MNDNWGYVIAGYSIAAGALTAYVVWLRQRIRGLRRSLRGDEPA